MKLMIYKKNYLIKILLCLAALAVVTSITGIYTYMKSAAAAVNTFAAGDVNIALIEENWDPSAAACIIPGQILQKDPKIENTGNNSCYAFMAVTVPKRRIYTYDEVTKERNELSDTELFTLRNISSDWKLILTTEDTNGITRIYAYTDGDHLVKLAPGDTTPAVFSQVKYCCAVEGQDLDTSLFTVIASGYAIQSENITSGDIDDPLSVWNIILKQIG